MPILNRNNPEHAMVLTAMKERIAELKDLLAGPHDIDETNRLRGGIGELQRIVTEAGSFEAPEPPSYA